VKIRIRYKVKLQELWRFKMEPWRAVDAHNGGALMLKFEPSRICRPEVAYSHHFDKENMGPDPQAASKVGWRSASK
jgi:hypothetical protein